VIRRVQAIENAHILADTDPSRIRFDFDAEWNPPYIILTDIFKQMYKNFSDDKRITRPLDEAALKNELAAGILFYDGQSKTWVNRRAMAYNGK